MDKFQPMLSRVLLVLLVPFVILVTLLTDIIGIRPSRG